MEANLPKELLAGAAGCSYLPDQSGSDNDGHGCQGVCADTVCLRVARGHATLTPWEASPDLQLWYQVHQVAALTGGPGPVNRYIYIFTQHPPWGDPCATPNLSPFSFMVVSVNRVPQSVHPQAFKSS